MNQGLHSLSPTFWIVLAIWLLAYTMRTKSQKANLERIGNLVIKPIIFKQDPNPDNVPFYPRTLFEYLSNASRNALQHPLVNLIEWLRNGANKMKSLIYSEEHPLRALGSIFSLILFAISALANVIAIVNTWYVLGLWQGEIPELFLRYDIAFLGGSVVALIAGWGTVLEIRSEVSKFTCWSETDERVRSLIMGVSLLVTVLSFSTSIALAVFRLISLHVISSSPFLNALLNWTFFALVPINSTLATAILFSEAMRGVIVASILIILFAVGVLYLLDYILTIFVEVSLIYFDIAYRAIYILAGDVAVGVAFGLMFGKIAGIAAGISSLLFHFRLPLYLIELPWQRIIGFFAETTPPERASRLFRLSPLYYDELIWLPLLGLDSALIEIGKKDRRLAQQAIADVAQSFRQGWAATNALIELTAYDVERAQDARAIANIAEQFAWLPPTMPRDLENVLPPLREIAQYAQAALESDTLYNKQTQLRAAIAQTQRVREGLALSRNRQIAARFGRALETWEQALRRELDALSAREIIPNVYVAGSPLATASKVFKGRRDLFLALERELATAAETRPTLLLFGARRCGKTSAIKQMPVRLGPDVIPVEVDLQSAATAEDASGLLFVLADQVRHNALTHRRVQLPPLTRDDLRADPYLVFGDWLNRVEEAVGTRWILLCLDEYERLEEMLEEGRIDRRVFHFLRHLIQHHPRLTVLLSGSHTLEDLSPMWSDYLINVRVLKIGNLKEDEARELIVQPIENFPLEYEPAAVERIIAVTGCQPYLVQATCRDLVNMLNEQNRTRATLADAEHALDSALTTGALYFQELWRGRDMDDTQRAILRALAAGRTLSALRDLPDLNSALRKLLRRDILMETPQGYQFRVELVRRWVEQHGDEP
jgi:hypothetical protein